MSLILLLATLAALLSGPLLYTLARPRPALLALLDGFLLVSIAGLVLLEAVPGAFSSGGRWSLVFLALGLLGPSVLEAAMRRARREAHLATLLLALLGLVVHALGDGIALSSGGEPADAFALPLAVALHSVPVGLVVWWLLFPVFGTRAPALTIAAMCAATITGYAFGPALGAELGSTGWAWFQALVAGSILHVVFGRPHLDENDHEHAATVSPRYEGLGNLLAIAGLVVLARLEHGHEQGHEATLASDFAAAFLHYALLAAPPLLAAYAVGGLIARRHGARAMLRYAAVRLVDTSAAWVLLLLAAAALLLPRVLPAAMLPTPSLVHGLALGGIAALYAGALLRRGGRAWLKDLWPRDAHGHTH